MALEESKKRERESLRSLDARINNLQAEQNEYEEEIRSKARSEVLAAVQALHCKNCGGAVFFSCPEYTGEPTIFCCGDCEWEMPVKEALQPAAAALEALLREAELKGLLFADARIRERVQKVPLLLKERIIELEKARTEGKV